MKRAYQRKFTSDEFIIFLYQRFTAFSDTRAGNLIYSIQDILMSAYAMFALKYASLLEFEQQNEVEKSNLQTVFGIQKLCSDASMRRILDTQSPESLLAIQRQLFSELSVSGILSDYTSYKGFNIVSIDGVQHFHSNKIHCDSCCKKTHQDGSVSFTHSMLCAALVHPDKKAVFSFAQEAIIQQDGTEKNDCELNANKRLLAYLSLHYKDENFLIVEDALYGNGENIKEILANNWSFIIRSKSGSQSSLFAQFERKSARNQTNKHSFKEAGIEHYYEWINDLALNNTHANIRVSFLKYSYRSKQGKLHTFYWMTDINLRKTNVKQISKIGRSRWKIENETFNTLKNQGYHFDHNYGHGRKNLTSVLAYIMLIAFFIDQVVQYTSKQFQKIWKATKTKKKLWEHFRAIFFTIRVDSFTDIYKKMGLLFNIKLAT